MRFKLCARRIIRLFAGSEWRYNSRTPTSTSAGELTLDASAREYKVQAVRMSGSSTALQGTDLLRGVELGIASIDEMSDVRHLHAASARRLAAGMLAEAEISAFAAHIYTDTYSQRIAEVVLARHLTVARISGVMAGTAGWTPANDAGSVARLVGVFVSPLHARQGLGKLLVEASETQARQAGFGVFTIRAPLGASPFFQHLGYEISSHGVWPLTRDIALPVAFLRKIANSSSLGPV